MCFLKVGIVDNEKKRTYRRIDQLHFSDRACGIGTSTVQAIIRDYWRRLWRNYGWNGGCYVHFLSSWQMGFNFYVWWVSVQVMKSNWNYTKFRGYLLLITYLLILYSNKLVCSFKYSFQEKKSIPIAVFHAIVNEKKSTLPVFFM